jgi:hypothetical protein
VVESTGFEDLDDGIPPSDAAITAKCGGAPDDVEIAFFFARGTATPGHITLQQPATGDTRTICVSALTARIEQEDDGVVSC